MLLKMDLQGLKQIVADAGDVGAGGAGFPTSMKLSDGADTLIINAAECEPLLYTDYYILKNYMDNVVNGAETVMSVLNIQNGILGVKMHTAKRLSLIDGQKLSEHVKVHCLPDVYPMGDEIILIYQVLHRIVTPGALPITAGVLVFNVETLYNVDQAVKSAKPVTEKFITVGGKINQAYVLKVPVGTQIKELFAHLGVAVPEECVVVNGGPAMGSVVDPEQAVITKTTKGLLILPRDLPVIAGKLSNVSAQLNRASSTCCQCTLCTEMCPRALIGYPLTPHKTVRSVANHVADNPEDYLTASLCCGCGVCELTACCQGLSPRRVLGEVRASLAKNGLRYQHTGEPVQANPDREYRMLPIERFKTRIGVAPFDRMPEPVETDWMPSRVILPLRQHVGAPAIVTVKVGDTVCIGDVIAQAAKGVSASIHSSVNGKVLSIDDKCIVINNK